MRRVKSSHPDQINRKNQLVVCRRVSDKSVPSQFCHTGSHEDEILNMLRAPSRATSISAPNGRDKRLITSSAA